MELVLALGATVVGLLFVVLGIEIRWDARRIATAGVPVVGTVTGIGLGLDRDLTLVEYEIAGLRYRQHFVNYPAAVGDPVELLVDPKSGSRAFIKKHVPARISCFGCLAVIGVVTFLGGVIGLVVFFTVVRAR